MAARIVLDRVGEVRFEPFDPPPVGAGQVLLRAVCSLMSTGGESLAFNGLFSQRDFIHHITIAYNDDTAATGSNSQCIAPGIQV
jgi:hypothetical protein